MRNNANDSCGGNGEGSEGSLSSADFFVAKLMVGKIRRNKNEMRLVHVL